MRTPITLNFLCAWIRPCTQKICAWSQPCANGKWKTKRALHKQNKRRPWWLWKSVENIWKAPWQNSKNKWCNPSESSIYIYPVSPRTSLNSEKEKGFHHSSPGIPSFYSFPSFPWKIRFSQNTVNLINDHAGHKQSKEGVQNTRESSSPKWTAKTRWKSDEATSHHWWQRGALLQTPRP